MLVVSRVNCAAFDSFVTEIRLQDANAPIRRDRKQVVASINDTRVVQVTWQDESSAVLFAPKGATVTVHKPELEGVRIEFR
jgi:hypothetical protein